MPNLLTCARVAMVPVVAAAVLARPGDWVLAGIVFFLASVSDALDGRIARARGCISRFGTIMDPIADKLLVGAALISLAIVGRAGAWLAAVIIARELSVSVLRVAARNRGLEIAASRLGKAKMALQVFTVLALMAVGTGAGWAHALVFLTVAVTVASGLDYALGYRSSIRARPAPVPVVSSLSTAPQQVLVRSR